MCLSCTLEQNRENARTRARTRPNMAHDRTAGTRDCGADVAFRALSYCMRGHVRSACEEAHLTNMLTGPTIRVPSLSGYATVTMFSSALLHVCTCASVCVRVSTHVCKSVSPTTHAEIQKPKWTQDRRTRSPRPVYNAVPTKCLLCLIRLD